jgi:hypothetical protein
MMPHQFQKHRYDRNRPEVHDMLRELRCMTDTYEGRLLVGEVFSMPPGDPKLAGNFSGTESANSILRSISRSYTAHGTHVQSGNA